MITESFLNSCFSLLINKKSQIKKTKSLYRDIIKILDFKTGESFDVPQQVQSKLDCLKKITEMFIDGKSFETIRDSISLSEKFKPQLDFLDFKMNEELNPIIFQDFIKQVRIRKKIVALFKNFDDLNSVLESIKDGSFDSIDDLVVDYEATIKTLYSNVMESNRSITIEASASLDLVKDTYENVLTLIQKKYQSSNKTPTGFQMIDKALLGGYDPSRLYIWGGGSGAGKSTMLNNTIIRSATMNPLLMNTPGEYQRVFKQGEINRVYIYVTMENTIEESLMRTYQPMFDKTTPMMLTDITKGIDIKKAISEVLLRNGSTIVMKYFPAMSVSVIDLMGVVDDVIEQYGKESIAGLYVDYLDLLKTDMKYDMYRLELGHITLSLKTLAVQYNIPVITASQLGRKIYSVQDSKDLSLDQMSESIKKVEHADFVALLGKDMNDDSIVHGKIGKNRSGKSNISLDFKVDFERFKFIECMYAANKEKVDAGTCAANVFDGFNTF